MTTDMSTRCKSVLGGLVGEKDIVVRKTRPTCSTRMQHLYRFVCLLNVCLFRTTLTWTMSTGWLLRFYATARAAASGALLTGAWGVTHADCLAINPPRCSIFRGAVGKCAIRTLALDKRTNLVSANACRTTTIHLSSAVKPVAGKFDISVLGSTTFDI